MQVLKSEQLYCNLYFLHYLMLEISSNKALDLSVKNKNAEMHLNYCMSFQVSFQEYLQPIHGAFILSLQWKTLGKWCHIIQ
jgi:hypothetical protein